MKNLFFTMSFFFILVGFLFFFLSFFFMSNFSSFFMEWNLIFKGFKISFPLFFDFKSCLFMGLVMLISGSIMFYSEFYMESEMYKLRFFFLMKLFVISMVFLILCPNFICMLVGWDGLGLISFCLVIFYQNFKSLSSGMLTALTNRVGDVFILSSIVLFFFNSSWNYMNFLNFYDQSLLIYMFILAAMTKSAQVPFSAWLPAAMAAPTPVSSLVHSSTLVTAGVYILIRFSYYFKYNHHMNFLILLGLLTMVMSGLGGIFEFDLKKVIALSTLSQLGFMMSTLSLNMPDLAFFHLLTHACFKALLFMCSGVFIHEFSENQDIRNLGFMNSNFSFSLCMFNIANLSLMGFPFLSGFFSKDLILELMIMKKLSLLIFFMFMFGTFLTVFYSIRLMVFLTFKSSFCNNCFMQNSKNLKIEKSMIMLFFFSIFLGFYMSKLFFFPFNYIIIPFNLKILISCICLFSFLFSLKFSYYIFFFKNLKLMMFFGTMWFLAFLKTDFLKKKILNFGMILSNSLEIFTEYVFGQKNIVFLFMSSFTYSNMFKKLIFFSFFIFFFMIMWVFFMMF